MARPPKPQVKFSARLDTKAFKMLETLSKAKGVTMTKLVEDLIDERFRSEARRFKENAQVMKDGIDETVKEYERLLQL